MTRLDEAEELRQRLRRISVLLEQVYGPLGEGSRALQEAMRLARQSV